MFVLPKSVAVFVSASLALVILIWIFRYSAIILAN